VFISVATLTVRWLAGWYLGARPRRLAIAKPRAATRVSVVIPARNEARMLPRLLQSLAAQTVPPCEMIVVNDDSSDDTAEVARATGATVIDAGTLPAGWTGKTWACARGAEVATGELLVFLDADTCTAPRLLESLVAAQERSGGVISVQPFHRMVRPYERFSACFNVVAGMGIGATSVRRDAAITGAYGPCLAVSRSDYERIGGHDSVASEVLEDVALARRARDVGLPVSALEGRDLVEFRMYPDGISSLGQGWSKNFAAGAGTTPLPRLLAIVAWVSGLIEAGWWTLAGLAVAPFGGEVSWLHATFYALFAVQLGVFLRRLGNFGVTAWLHPIAVAAFLLVFVRSLGATLRGEVQWKDRTVKTRLRVGA
jgi:4,4'-diaponeurosporenoate glycosyltransferase